MEILSSILFVLFVLFVALFWVWMLVDCATKESNEGNTKVIWILIILLPNPNWTPAVLFRETSEAILGIGSDKPQPRLIPAAYFRSAPNSRSQFLAAASCLSPCVPNGWSVTR
jgi:hypothetical protein